MKKTEKTDQLRRSNRIKGKTAICATLVQHDPCTPSSKVFRNPLVLSMILENVATSDLIKYRLVNSEWLDLSTSILIRYQKHRDDIKIQFKYNQDSNIFMLVSRQNGSTNVNRRLTRTSKYANANKTLTLLDLNNVLKHSKRFPCVNFSFEKGDLGKSDAQSFFQIHGKCIKKIKFDLSNAPGTSSYTKLRTFRHLLLNQAVNMEELNIVNFPPSWSIHYNLYNSNNNNNNNSSVNKNSFRFRLFPDEDGNSSKFILPKLNSLIVSCRDHHMIIISDILKAAKNLQCFEFKDFDGMKCMLKLIELDKIKLLKSLFMMPMLEEVEYYDLFARASPKLSSLILSMIFVQESNSHWPKMSNSLSMILHSSKYTLTNLHLSYPIGFLDIKWPVLPNVTEFHLSLYRKPETDEEVFSKDFKMSRIMPKVASIYINVGTFQTTMTEDASWRDCFPFMEKTSTVKTLEILDCPLVWLPLLSDVFPAVQTLKIFSIKNFTSFGKFIWTFQNLQQLDFDIDIDSNSGHPNFSIDSAMLGLKVETCQKLNKVEVEVLDIVKLKVDSSILDLRNLQQLNIRFAKDFSVPISNLSSIPSPLVTGRFGFLSFPWEQQQQLQINLSIRPYHFISSKKSHIEMLRKLEDALSLMKPYANVITTNDRN